MHAHLSLIEIVDGVMQKKKIKLLKKKMLNTDCI